MKKALGLASLAGLALLAREVYRQRLVQQALLTWASAVDGLTSSEDPAEKAVLRSDLEGARRKLNGLEFRPYLSGKLGGPNVKESGPMGGGRDRPDRPDPGLAAEMRERARVAAEQAAREAAAAREVAARETAAREAATREAEAREFAIREEEMRAEKVRQDQAREASRDRDRQVEAAAERLTRAADKWNNAATPKEKGELVQEMLDARRKLDELMAKPSTVAICAGRTAPSPPDSLTLTRIGKPHFAESELLRSDYRHSLPCSRLWPKAGCNDG